MVFDPRTSGLDEVNESTLRGVGLIDVERVLVVLQVLNIYEMGEKVKKNEIYRVR